LAETRPYLGHPNFCYLLQSEFWIYISLALNGRHLPVGEVIHFPPLSKVNSNSDTAANQWNVAWWTHPKIFPSRKWY